MALQFTEQEIEQDIVDPIIVLINQALSGADNETVKMVVDKFKAAAEKLNANETLDIAKIVHVPLTIGAAIAAKTPTAKDDAAFSVLEIIYNICFGGANGGLFALLKLGGALTKVKKAE